MEMLEDSNDGDDDKKTVPCTSFLGHWRKCTSATHHLHHYYIYGEFADCTLIKSLIKNCFYYKMKKTEDYKEQFLSDLKKWEDKVNFVHKPSALIWEFRENPAADWLKKDV